MNSHTATVSIQAEWKKVYDFLANPANLPKWAVCFCQGIKHEADAWIATTPMGEMTIRYDTDAERGLIDLYDASDSNPAFTRVVPNGPEGTEYIFTFFQGPEIPDEVFAEQIKGLKTEFGVLKDLMEN